MMQLLRRYQYHIFLFTMAIFLAGTFIGFGSYFFTKGPSEAIAEVNGHKIPARLFIGRYLQEASQIPPNAPNANELRVQHRDQILRDLIQNIVLADEAERYGVAVPDQQVAVSLVQIPAFNTKGQFDPNRYGQMLQALRITPKDFEEEQRRGIAFFKLRWLAESVIKVTDQEAEMAYAAEHKGSLKGYAKDGAAFRAKLQQEKMGFALNQWFMQISQRLKVKTHFDVLEGMAR